MRKQTKLVAVLSTAALLAIIGASMTSLRLRVGLRKMLHGFIMTRMAIR